MLKNAMNITVNYSYQVMKLLFFRNLPFAIWRYINGNTRDTGSKITETKTHILIDIEVQLD